MLINDLYLFGEKRGYDTTLLWKEELITNFIDVNEDGSFVLTSNKIGDIVSVVFEIRTRADKPNCLWDYIDYYQKIEKQEHVERNVRRNKLFWDRAEGVLVSANDLEALSVIKKLKNCDLTKLKFKTPGRFAIRINGRPVIGRELVRSFLDREAENGDKGSDICLVSGKPCTAVKCHPEVVIKGFRNSSPLISFNTDVFKYKGITQGNNFPISQTVANAYTKALEDIATDVIALHNGSENRVAVLLWSSEDSKNRDNIRVILHGKEPGGWRNPDWNFATPIGNIHFLALDVVQSRMPILAYDVFPESLVIESLLKFKHHGGRLFENNSITKSIYTTVGWPWDKSSCKISPELIVQYFRYALFGVMYPKALKHKIVQVINNDKLNKHYQKGLDKYLDYVSWVEFFLLTEKESI